MASVGSEWRGLSLVAVILLGCGIMVSGVVSKNVNVKNEVSLSSHGEKKGVDSDDFFTKVVNFFWQPRRLGYTHIWPDLRFGWKIIVGSIIGFIGAAFGSVGGVGGGGIFVPMLTLIIGFDAKSSTAISKCMITGAAGATVYYNLKLRHPTLDMPVIDYDLALLFQPMLVLGISVGVALNVIFADWMVTVLLIILFLGMSTKSFFKGVETWKKESIIIKEASRPLESNVSASEEANINPLPGAPSNGPNISDGPNMSNGPNTSNSPNISNDPNIEIKDSKRTQVSIIENVYWMELGLLFAVWIVILALQIGKNYTTTCSWVYWALNLLQIPVTVGVSSYEAVSLHKGRRIIASRGENGTNFKVHQLILYCTYGVIAGIVGGLLGLGGGFILGPLFLELGVPPQVSSATSTFVMTFSASMSVIEYYLLKRFPVPYALYFAAVATIAALVGQHVVTKIINILGRASLIIFVLSITIFVSAISLGGVGISNIVKDAEKHEYMGFENLCTYH